MPYKQGDRKLKQEIIKNIQKIAGKYAADSVFSDWVHCCAIAIQNTCYMDGHTLKKRREQEYQAISGKYDREELLIFSDMIGMLALELEDRPRDVLGEIYMELEAGSRQTGQFFTPYHISEATAGLAITGNISPENPFKIYEPSVGSGGMIIAVAMKLKDKGMNYQTCMKVTAQDLDYRSVYMAYVQFSLMGLDAVVVQGDTLSEPYGPEYSPERVWKTPRRMGAIL